MAPEAALSRQIAATLALGGFKPAATPVIGPVHARVGWISSAHASSTAANVNRAAFWQEEWPIWGVPWTMIDHDLHDGGEIGVLRDLYRERNMTTTSTPASGARA